MSLNNECRLLGNLVKEPSIIESERGKFGKIRVAVNTKRGEIEDTLFIDVNLFGQSFNEEDVSSMIKGDRVLIYGRLVVEEYEDKEGIKRKEPVVYAFNVIKLAKRIKSTDGSEF